MPSPEKVILPPKYYLEYFKYLIDFIRDGSAHCLSDSDMEFIENLNGLSENAQCLMVRMINRKGDYFRLDKISYAEISNIPIAADELASAGFISFDPPNDPLIFRLFTKTELHHLFPEKEFKKKYKEEILVQLSEECTSHEYAILTDRYTILHFLYQEQIEYLKLLFFGHCHGMMTEFVIRDVGHIKLESREEYTFTPWFESRAEAVAVFQLSGWSKVLRQAMEVMLPEEVLELVREVNWSDYLGYSKTRKPGDKLMLRLGEYLEKSGFLKEAMEYYSLAKKHPARERRIRILESLARIDEAKELAQIALDHPFNASEKIFLQDYLAKESKRNYRSTTARIKESPEITIPRIAGMRVEDLALDHFNDKGFQGLHSENYIWRSIFGLLFWEELFDHTQATFHHPLQRMPSDLYNDSFYETRKSFLVSKVASFRSRKALSDYILKTHDAKSGINNPLVGWHPSLPGALEACISHLPVNGLKRVMLEIAKNVKDNCTGFPDLFIWNDTEYFFYEVKSPNDHLSAQQLFWMDFFSENNIRADILRVRYL